MNEDKEVSIYLSYHHPSYCPLVVLITEGLDSTWACMPGNKQIPLRGVAQRSWLSSYVSAFYLSGDQVIPTPLPFRSLGIERCGICPSSIVHDISIFEIQLILPLFTKTPLVFVPMRQVRSRKGWFNMFSFQI